MRKLFVIAATVALVGALTASPVLAEGHNFKVYREATINGDQLKPGTTYKLVLNGNDEALIYRHKELVTKAAVEVRSLEGRQRTSVVLDSDGNLLEIRFKKQVVVFPRHPKARLLPADSQLRLRRLPA